MISVHAHNEILWKIVDSPERVNEDDDCCEMTSLNALNKDMRCWFISSTISQTSIVVTMI